jgi:hypothetical protein
MSQNQNNKVTIDVVDPPHEGQGLLGCYFEYDSSNHTYSFFDVKGKRLATGLQPGKHFHFKLPHFPHMKWRLSISKDSTPTTVLGKWKEKPDHEHFGNEEWEPDQSYQAGAGGAVGDDVNVAAAAQ